MPHLRHNLVASGLLVPVAVGAAAQPSITGIHSSELPRSGRVASEGSGFGGCGLPPLAEQPGATCGDGINSDCDAFTDCDDLDCATDAACRVCSLGAKNDACTSDLDCCSGTCKSNGRCR